MGCSASKHQPGQNDRSSSLPGSNAKANGEISSRNPWKSASRTSATVDGHYVTSQQVKPSSRFKPVREEDLFSTSPVVKSRRKICEYADSLMQSKSISRNHLSSCRSASFGSAHDFKAKASVSPVGIGDINGNDSLGLKDVESKVFCKDSKDSSFRGAESINGFTGLRLLLSPVATPSRTFASSARHGTLSKVLSFGGQHALNQSIHNVRHSNNHCTQTRLANKQAIQAIKVIPSQVEGMGDSQEVVSPLFDPSLLATFEKAIEISSDDNWPSSDVISGNCSKVHCLSSDTSSDAESLHRHKDSSTYRRMQNSSSRLKGIDDVLFKAGDYDVCYQSSAAPKKKPSSKVIPLRSNAWVTDEYLQDFEMKCPPGCEDKIVLYFTSLRGIRKTFEDCRTVRLILKGFGLQVDERDVWMHALFRQELTKVMGTVLAVPRLFVRGRYIGGVEDVRHLHEEGMLGYLLDGLPEETRSKCSTCAGIRFIPCMSCNGSCKLMFLREVSRCPDCNENGLMMCPSCY